VSQLHACVDCGRVFEGRGPRCPEHARAYKNRRQQDYRARVKSSLGPSGSTRRWRRIRALALQRDHYLCVPCQAEGKVTPAVEVDHIVPRSQGGTDDLDNLRSVCAEHNPHVASQPAAAPPPSATSTDRGPWLA
jgi:5-methylcytosine-specific restriction protein A